MPESVTSLEMTGYAVLLLGSLTALYYGLSLLVFSSGRARSAIFSVILACITLSLAGYGYLIGQRQAMQQKAEMSATALTTPLPQPVAQPVAGTADTHETTSVPSSAVKGTGHHPSLTAAAAPSAPAIITPPADEETRQYQLDRLKRRYEEILINAMILKKCGLARGDEMAVISGNYLKELASIDPQVDMYPQILSAASGSYEALYAEVECTEESILQLLTDYQQFMEAMRSSLHSPR
jgi:hypothetical protein